MKLSKAQLDVLKVLRDGGEVLQTEDGYAFTDWWNGEETINKRTFRILVESGAIIDSGHFCSSFKLYELTPAGREALGAAGAE